MSEGVIPDSEIKKCLKIILIGKLKKFMMKSKKKSKTFMKTHGDAILTQIIKLNR